MKLLDYSKNVYSQTGEDGILDKILQTIAPRDFWCVEFGAWDGEHLSNTFNVIKNANYSAVLIEASKVKFVDLANRFNGNKKIMPMNCFVGFGPKDNLDTLLGNTPIPKKFDLLSIDIDGNDYHVWKAVESYTPKIVVIEYNPTIPNGIDFVQPADPNVSQGSSLQSMVKLGKQKGYELVAVTKYNGIFVLSEYFGLFNIACNKPETLREDMTAVTQVFCGYDGTIFVAGADNMPWHGMRVSSRVRQLPKFFRQFAGNFGPVRQRAFSLYKRIQSLAR